MSNDAVIKIVFLSLVLTVIVVVAYLSDKDFDNKFPFDDVVIKKKSPSKKTRGKHSKGAHQSLSPKVTVKDNQKEPKPLMEVYKDLYEDNANKTASNIKVKLPTVKK